MPNAGDPLHGDGATLDDAVAVLNTVLVVASDVTLDAAVNRLQVRAKVERLDRLPHAQLFALATQGHAVELTLRQGSWTATIRAEGPGLPALDMAGPAEDALNTRDVTKFQEAVDTGNATAALQTAGYVPAELVVSIRNDPHVSGHHWVATSQALLGELQGQTWVKTISQLGQAPRTVIIGNAGAGAIRTRHLVLRGPATDAAHFPEPPVPPAPIAQTDDRLRLPDPAIVADATVITSAPGLVELVPWLHGLERTLIWFHLSSKATLTNGVATVRLEGARSILTELKPVRLTNNPRDDLALYEWAREGLDPGRRDAAVHATTLAMVDPSTFEGVASPALRNAKTIYELSRRGAVAEALATRRSARDAALGSARTAGAVGREVAGKATERALVQIGAAIAVVLSNSKNIIGQSWALLLLGLVASLALASMLTAVRRDLPSARAMMDAELEDLDQYREALGEDDINLIRSLKALEATRRQLRGARTVVIWLYSSTVAVILVMGAISAFTPTAAPTPTPGSSPTATTSPSVPAGQPPGTTSKAR